MRTLLLKKIAPHSTPIMGCLPMRKVALEIEHRFIETESTAKAEERETTLSLCSDPYHIQKRL